MLLATGEAYCDSAKIDTDAIDAMTENMVEHGLEFRGTWHTHRNHDGEFARHSHTDLKHWQTWQRCPRPWGAGGEPLLGLIITPGFEDSWSHPRPTAHIIRAGGDGKQTFDYVDCEYPGGLGPLRTSVPRPWEL
jgi:hypothetical protein